MKIYTKTGDDGSTSLFDGTRVSKASARVDLYGEIDELNGVIGLAASFVQDPDFLKTLYAIQKDLFAFGAQLANPQKKKQKDKSDFGDEKITALETQIDAMETKLKPMTSFILPGGSHASGCLHLARSVCRRAERKLVHFAEEPEHGIEDIYLKYLNRLSDHLFVAARYANFLEGKDDVPW